MAAALESNETKKIIGLEDSIRKLIYKNINNAYVSIITPDANAANAANAATAATAANAVYTPRISNNKTIEDLYRVCEFLRSYIDYHHDFDDRCSDIILYIKNEFESIYFDSRNSNTIIHKKTNEFYTHWLNVIDTPIKGIKSSTGTVIDSHCQFIMEAMIEDFLNIKAIHDAVPWIPSTKIQGKQYTFNQNYVRDPYMKISHPVKYKKMKLANDIEISRLIKEHLSRDGVEVIAVESTCTSKEMLCLARPKDRDFSSEIRLALLDIGKWDAGSGVLADCKTIEFVSTPNDVCNVSNKNQLTIGVNYQIPPIIMFGIAKVTIYDNNTRLRVSSKTNKEIYIEIQGPIELSVDLILATIERDTLRIAKHKKELSKIQFIESATLQIQQNRQMIVSAYLTLLKTYTDLVQIRFLSSYKPLNIHQMMQQSSKRIPRNIQVGPIKIGMVIYDKLCEITAWLYGLGHVLLTNKDRSVVYNSYDIRSIQPTPEILNNKASALFNVYISLLISGNPSSIERVFIRDIQMCKNNIKSTIYPSEYCINTIILESTINQYRKVKTEISKIKNLKLNEQLNGDKNEDIINTLSYFQQTEDDWIDNMLQSDKLLNEKQQLEILFIKGESYDNKAIDNKILEKLQSRTDILDFINLCNEINDPLIQSMNKIIVDDVALVKCIGYYILYTYYIHIRKKIRKDNNVGETILYILLNTFQFYKHDITHKISNIEISASLFSKIRLCLGYSIGLIGNKGYKRHVGNIISYILPLFTNVKNIPDIHINIVIYMYNLYVYLDTNNMPNNIPFIDIINIDLVEFERIYNINMIIHDYPELNDSRTGSRSRPHVQNYIPQHRSNKSQSPPPINPQNAGFHRKKIDTQKRKKRKNYKHYTLKKRNQRKHSTRRNTKK